MPPIHDALIVSGRSRDALHVLRRRYAAHELLDQSTPVSGSGSESAGEFTFDDGREVEMKGISGPQRVHAVEWR